MRAIKCWHFYPKRARAQQIMMHPYIVAFPLFLYTHYTRNIVVISCFNFKKINKNAAPSLVQFSREWPISLYVMSTDQNLVGFQISRVKIKTGISPGWTALKLLVIKLKIRSAETSTREETRWELIYVYMDRYGLLCILVLPSLLTSKFDTGIRLYA